jgi:hypothetical protein
VEPSGFIVRAAWLLLQAVRMHQPLTKEYGMRFLMSFRFPADVGNKRLQDPKFGATFQEVLKQIKAEAVYLCPVCGDRGGYIVLSFDDASKIATVGEQMWCWLNAKVEFTPVMTPEDLGRAMPEIKMALERV